MQAYLRLLFLKQFLAFLIHIAFSVLYNFVRLLVLTALYATWYETINSGLSADLKSNFGKFLVNQSGSFLILMIQCHDLQHLPNMSMVETRCSLIEN